MSTQGCGVKHPLKRDGMSQGRRVLAALSPDYVKVDERTTRDLLVFTADLAEKVRYFNSTNTADGTWEPFFLEDISTRISLISIHNTDQVREDWDDLFETALAGSGDPAQDLKALFDFIIGIANDLEEWADAVEESETFYAGITNLIKSKLRRPMKRLIGYDKGAATATNLAAAVGADYSELSDLWIYPSELHPPTLDWETYVSDNSYTPPIDDIYAGTDAAEEVASAAEKLKFIFTIVFETQVRVVNDSLAYLEATLEDWPSHNPNMALFLSFLLVFKEAQDHINTLTEAHLEFYYQDVLQLQPNDPEPDQVHLIFELAKNVVFHKVDDGVKLKAGKDSEGKELLYAMEEEVVVNKGAVAELKTVYLHDKEWDRVFSSPIANSADGEGADFEKDDELKSWDTFGSEDRNEASFGYAFSSPILDLAEGNREITLQLLFDGDSYLAMDAAMMEQAQECIPGSVSYDFNDLFKVYFTTAEGWAEYSGSFYTSGSDQSIVFYLSIGEDQPGIINFDPSVHEGDFDAEYPMMKVEVVNTDGTSSPYFFLRHLDLLEAQITVNVTGVKNLIVQNDITVLNAEKEFEPYGPSPSLNQNFYIGSREIFSKKLDSLSINMEWVDLPKNLATYYAGYSPITPTPCNVEARFSLLEGRQWKNVIYDMSSSEEVADGKLFRGSSFASGNPNGPCNTGSPPPTTTNPSVIFSFGEMKTGFPGASNVVDRDETLPNFTQLENNTQRGFLRMQLIGPTYGATPDPSISPLGHRQYPALLSEKTLALADETFNPSSPAVPTAIPNAPYTPKVKTISVNYSSSVTMDLRFAEETGPVDRPAFADRVEKFFHVRPFGQEEVHPDTYEPFAEETEKNAKIDHPVLHLLPQWEGEGQLFIGISGMDLKKSSSISLLFQVAEGTADPDVHKPDITWSYLGDNNEWFHFETYEITGDTTNGLVTSGLMVFNLPQVASNECTILPTGYHWIRAHVEEDSAGIADVIEVVAQAGLATFSDNENASDHLANPLASGTIAKLKVKQAQVKGIAQPYASFDGKVTEKDDNFYLRVSERLRHKDRAITIWDYEALILQEFPDLYKVKCISHTNKYTELAPGFVYVVLVTKQINKNAVNPLEPRATVNTIDLVRKFLCKRSSPFVKLDVRNPSYERIRLDFKVKFLPGKDVGFYELKINEDIKQFLTPWAYEDSKEISFEGSIHSSVILDFVEELDYVDYLTEFKMFFLKSDGTPEAETKEAIASSPMAILVSAAQHTIEVLEPSDSDEGDLNNIAAQRCADQ